MQLLFLQVAGTRGGRGHVSEGKKISATNLVFRVLFMPLLPLDAANCECGFYDRRFGSVQFGSAFSPPSIYDCLVVGVSAGVRGVRSEV